MIDGLIDPATLEVIACREAVALVVDLLLHNFIISSDCKQVASDIKRVTKAGMGPLSWR